MQSMNSSRHISKLETLSKPETVDARRAADMLGVHIATVRRWEKAGLLKCWRTPGGYRRFNIDDVRALKAAGGSQ